MRAAKPGESVTGIAARIYLAYCNYPPMEYHLSEITPDIGYHMDGKCGDFTPVKIIRALQGWDRRGSIPTSAEDGSCCRFRCSMWAISPVMEITSFVPASLTSNSIRAPTDSSRPLGCSNRAPFKEMSIRRVRYILSLCAPVRLDSESKSSLENLRCCDSGM